MGALAVTAKLLLLPEAALAVTAKLLLLPEAALGAAKLLLLPEAALVVTATLLLLPALVVTAKAVAAKAVAAKAVAATNVLLLPEAAAMTATNVVLLLRAAAIQERATVVVNAEAQVLLQLNLVETQAEVRNAKIDCSDFNTSETILFSCFIFPTGSGGVTNSLSSTCAYFNVKYSNILQ